MFEVFQEGLQLGPHDGPSIGSPMIVRGVIPSVGWTPDRRNNSTFVLIIETARVERIALVAFVISTNNLA